MKQYKLKNFHLRKNEKADRGICSPQEKERIMKTDKRKWFVLVAGFICFALVAGFPYSLGLFYVEWLEEFGKSNSETALVQSVCLGIFMIGGFLSGAVITKYGSRKCAIFGGILSTGGVGLSFFATSITHLVLLVGIVSGFGFSLSYIGASTMVGKNFEGKQKMMALAIIAVGSGVGASIFPVLLQNLIYEFGWRGTTLITSGITFHIVICGCIFSERQESRDKLSSNEKVLYTNFEQEISKTDSIFHIELFNSTESMNKTLSQNDTAQSNIDTSISSMAVFKEILLNKAYTAYVLTFAMSLASMNTTIIFFIDYFQTKGMTRSEAVNIYLYMNITSSLFRLLPGILKQIPHVSVLAIPAMSTSIGSISMAMFFFTGSSLTLNIITSCGFGIATGGMIAVMSVAIVKLVGQENYSTGLGISMTSVGIINSGAGPLSGECKRSKI
ncbi:SLC16A14 [Mytilus coruscus]|uniref:SLC16A14 n=1 Tax=Mytilus coruscus TaxID=42192 RepID=A0A6J8E0M0_MYTCO|nr:SLC16A14 [Mytilus coruscus]